MPLIDISTIDAIMPSLRAGSKKQALQEVSERAASLTGLDKLEVFDAILQRERLGSTGVGSGIAIPHCKLKKATGIFGVFARLEKPVDFDAQDAAPVDLIFLLIAPERAGADHLKALARIARVMRDGKFVASLRATRDANALFMMLTEQSTSHAA